MLLRIMQRTPLPDAKVQNCLLLISYINKLINIHDVLMFKNREENLEKKMKYIKVIFIHTHIYYI